MGLERFDSEHPDVSLDTTVQQLIEIYGEEAVRRGVNYIDRLSEADENFREASNKADQYGSEYSRAVVGKEGDTEDLENKWAESVEDSGLGIDD